MRISPGTFPGLKSQLPMTNLDSPVSQCMHKTLGDQGKWSPLEATALTAKNSTTEQAGLQDQGRLVMGETKACSALGLSSWNNFSGLPCFAP